MNENMRQKLNYIQNVIDDNKISQPDKLYRIGYAMSEYYKFRIISINNPVEPSHTYIKIVMFRGEDLHKVLYDMGYDMNVIGYLDVTEQFENVER